jgi:hypothetical protein
MTWKKLVHFIGLMHIKVSYIVDIKEKDTERLKATQMSSVYKLYLTSYLYLFIDV